MKDKKKRGMDLDTYLGDVKNKGRTMLLPALIKTQKDFGYISKANAEKISAALRVPMADITGVIEFYSMLHAEPTGEKIIRVCTSPTCSSQGGRELIKELENSLDVQANSTTADGKYFIEEVQCLGLCDHAPAALVDEKRVGQANLDTIFNSTADVETKVFAKEAVLTARFGAMDPVDIDAYKKQQGFIGLKNAFAMQPIPICQAISESGLLGRGGAAFQTKIKWQSAREADGTPKYIVCNADESEPGTFKDRMLLENDPFAVLEGMLIGGYSVGAETGYIYVRGEYQKAQAILLNAIEAMTKAGYLGENIQGSGFNFEIELRSGAGAYICGEETALFESIEGKRGFPRLKPPFPTTHGLFQKPTVINNVETFANVSLILRIGVDSYCKYGTQQSSGPWLFCLSGDVEKPGIYEITSPVTLREMVFDLGGGMKHSKTLKTVLLGGAAGKFVSSEQIDLRLTQEDTRAAGLSLGSGAVIVLNEERDIRQTLVDLGRFFEHESCGKCFPCQLGTHQQFEILERGLLDRKLPGDVERLQDVGWTMKDASLCGLGQTAATAVLSAIDFWPELFD